jgi:hypothetical protein
MIILILILASFILLAGVAMLVNPAYFARLLADSAYRVELHVLAVVIRLLLGGLLVYCAAASRFPFVIHVLGWVSVIAALVLAVIGRQRFIALMNWALQWVQKFGRVAGLIAAALGAFLIYAFV